MVDAVSLEGCLAMQRGILDERSEPFVLLVPQAMGPRTASDASQIPGADVRDLQDRVLSAEFQAATAALAGCSRVVDLPRSRSPCFPMPESLVPEFLRGA